MPPVPLRLDCPQQSTRRAPLTLVAVVTRHARRPKPPARKTLSRLKSPIRGSGVRAGTPTTGVQATRRPSQELLLFELRPPALHRGPLFWTRTGSRAPERGAWAKIASVIPPRVHVTGPVPAAIEAALREQFELVDEPAGADGILVLLTTTVDDAYLELAGPGAEGRRELRGRRQQHRPRRRPCARRRRREHAGRAHARDRRARDRADALAAPARDRGRPDDPRAQAVGLLARVHARREPRWQALRRHRPGPDRPRDGAPRRGVRRDGALRRPRRPARAAARRGGRGQPALPAHAGDAPPDRRGRARGDAADARCS